MKAFSYVSAQSAGSAVELVRGHGRFLAGGMDLLGEMKEGLVEPALLVDIKAVPGTRAIAAGPDRWSIGANVTLAELADHAEMRRVLPAVAQAADDVGSPQMRNLATIGGNLAQHSRCWYYRHRDVHCYKKGGGKCFARSGENKYHSLFVKSQCLSPCVSNLAVALSALDATVIVQRGGATTSLTIAQLYDRAWKNGRVHNSLEPDDLIVRVEIPTPAGGRSAYLQLAEKSEFDWALVSCAAAGRLEGGRLRGARVALGCVAAVPWQVAEANAFLEGRELNDATATQAAELLLQEATAREHNAYKVPLAKTIIRRTLAKLTA